MTFDAPLRVSTGNTHLDATLHGGFLARRPYIFVGPVGTGKTKLALQFLCDGVRRGESVLFVTLEEPPNEIKANHRALRPELDEVYVFDAIPDVVRYEHTPFIDMTVVRHSMPFADVPDHIRKTPELTSVEVSFGALEQMLKMELARRNYSRLVIDSLTALEYFGMKGTEEMFGAQTFLRLLSDLGATTVLTVEAPVKEVDTVERLLARGEVRLFRWELNGRSLRAIGVEKFRGSAHDVRLHPYTVSPHGLTIDLTTTVSRDTRRTLSTDDSLGEESTDYTAPSAAVPSWDTYAEPVPRVPIGITGLDRMLNGGLLPGRPYLVTGRTGTGKSLLGLTFLLEGQRRGEDVLLIAVDEPPREILENVHSMGWDLSEVHILDANAGTRVVKGLTDVPRVKEISDVKRMAEISQQLRRPPEAGEVTLQSIHTKLRLEMTHRHFSRVLIDSITSIRRLPLHTPAERQARRTEVQSLLRFLSEQEATTLVTAMPGDPMILTPEEILTRGEIRLTRKWVGDRAIRQVKVVRMRGSSHDPERRAFSISGEGIVAA